MRHAELCNDKTSAPNQHKHNGHCCNPPVVLVIHCCGCLEKMVRDTPFIRF
jgi:hypothetical protein